MAKTKEATKTELLSFRFGTNGDNADNQGLNYRDGDGRVIKGTLTKSFKLNKDWKNLKGIIVLVSPFQAKAKFALFSINEDTSIIPKDYFLENVQSFATVPYEDRIIPINIEIDNSEVIVSIQDRTEAASFAAAAIQNYEVQLSFVLTERIGKK